MKGKDKIKIKVPEPIMTLWFAKGMFSSNCFESEKEILKFYKEKKKEQKDLRNLEPLDDSADFIDKMNRGTELIEASLPVIEKYEYLGQFLGKTDVFRKTTYDKKGKEKVSFITCGVDIDHYSCLIIDSRKGLYWNGEIGDLSEIYSAFREHGIKFYDDIYGKEACFLENLGKQLKKDFPKLFR